MIQVEERSSRSRGLCPLLNNLGQVVLAIFASFGESSDNKAEGTRTI